MRNRQMTVDGDYLFGYGANFLVDTPEAVGQAVLTRLKLFAGEWFLDNREGLDLDQILGYGTQATRDQQVQQRILGTPGVKAIASYSSQVSGRAFSVTATLDTIYGKTTISEVL
jgi:hypothetical protein